MGYIPQGAIHSLNNVGKETAIMVIGFSSLAPVTFDLPTVFNGVPALIRDAYTSLHTQLRHYLGPIHNPIVGNQPLHYKCNSVNVISPYRIDLCAVTPLFSQPGLGSVVWAVTDNWPILDQSGLADGQGQLSFIRTILDINCSRDCIW